MDCICKQEAYECTPAIPKLILGTSCSSSSPLAFAGQKQLSVHFQGREIMCKRIIFLRPLMHSVVSWAPGTLTYTLTARAHTHTHTHANTHTRAHTYIKTGTDTHTRTRKRTNTHMRIFCWEQPLQAAHEDKLKGCSQACVTALLCKADLFVLFEWWNPLACI